MKRIFIWGIGERTKYYLNLNYFNDCEIKGYICTLKEQESYNGLPVYSVEELICHEHEVDYVVIANEFYEEIILECKSKDINLDKLVMTDNIPLEPYKTYYRRLALLSEDLFELLEKTPFILVKSNEYDLIDSNMVMKKGKYNRSVYMQDYFRFRTFELVANEMMKNGVHGAVAELGVFRAHFSSLINEHFKDRKLYLFDTFEGFEEKEAFAEMNSGRCGERFIKEHKDTSVERALHNLPFPEQAIVCKGFFPQSVTKEADQEEFAFVSIDVDFEESMYQGLKFFYPRLVTGGIIFVHDYNTYFLDGIKSAIERFERDETIHLAKIPIADRAGTLIITKS